MFEYYDPEATEPAQTQTKPPIKGKPGKKRANFTIRGRGKAKGHESTATQTEEKTWQQSLKPWVNLLYIALLVAIVPICFWNIQPYEAAVRFVASRFGDSALLQFLLWFPLTSWLMQAGGSILFWLIGLAIWAPIQIIELMPLLMTNHPGYVRAILNQHETSPKFRLNQTDPGIVRHLKKFYNRMPLRFLILARRLRGVVYVVDMVIVMAVYPPVNEGGIERFFFLLGTGQWNRLDWGNIFLMFITLFAVEAIVKLVLIVQHFRRYLKASKPVAA